MIQNCRINQHNDTINTIAEYNIAIILHLLLFFNMQKPNTLKIGIVAVSIDTNIQFNKPNEILIKSLPSNI